MQTENQTIRGQQLLVQLASWGAELNQLKNIEDNQDDVECFYKAFLASDWADDSQLRNSAIVFFEQLQKLFTVLNQFSVNEFDQMDRLILKLSSSCITETA